MKLLLQNLAYPAKQRVVVAPGSDGVILGRAHGLVPGPDWPDDFLSRQHVRIWKLDDHWMVERVKAQKGKEKSLIYRDAARTKPLAEPHPMQPGEWIYVARKGFTAFTLVEREDETPPPEYLHPAEVGASDSSPPWRPRPGADTYDKLDLDYGIRLRLKALQEELPRAIERWLGRSASIAGAEPGARPQCSDEESLFDEVSGVLELALGARATGGQMCVAFLAVDPEALLATAGLHMEQLEALTPMTRGWRFLNADPSMNVDFRPSRRILKQVLALNPGTMGSWDRKSVPTAVFAPLDSLGFQQDWVMAMQLKGSGLYDAERSMPLKLQGQRVILYVAYHGATEPPPEDVQPFLRTVALQLSSLLETLEHQRRQTQLARYFSPRVRQLICDSPDALRPEVFNCTVLFCDRRGSSLDAERIHGTSDLLDKLHENTQILGLVADEVFQTEGITDATGDSVLGFWGWPPVQGDSKHALLAIETAMRIAAALKDRMVPDETLSADMSTIVFEETGERKQFDLRYPIFRIGISTGDMAVGNVGLREQMKIGVFGGPVNFGSRLEGLGKLFQLPVIVSEETRKAVGDRALMRRLCLMKPAGFEKLYPIYELVLDRELGGSGATPEQVQRYELALQHFIDRKFGLCIRQLTDLVNEGDSGSVWLLKTARHFQQNKPPAGWLGEIIAASK